MNIKDKGDHYKAKVTVGKEKLVRLFKYDPKNKASQRQAYKDARYWIDTRSSVQQKDKAVVANLNESISTVGGKLYVYLRLRKKGKILKSISTGRVANKEPETLKAHRASERYREAAAELEGMNLKKG